MKSVKCPNCGLVSFGSVDACRRCGHDFVAASARRAASPQLRQVILSTGDAPFSYKIIDVVFAYGNSSQTFFKGINPMEAYEKVSNMLEQAAAGLGADAVLWVKYDYRVAQGQGLLVANPVCRFSVL